MYMGVNSIQIFIHAPTFLDLNYASFGLLRNLHLPKSMYAMQFQCCKYKSIYINGLESSNQIFTKKKSQATTATRC